ncbi:ABC transporter permease [Actinomadura sp. 7K507]|uniref:ABC transporter permease n=1 Tax=Actinomadura sp. 7K507 TaxID=2530365 RepID=UPI00104F67EA|nr:ABC transporter permease [Actinomadura sp. 7K507]TDC89828.1 ABC transporter permease [Actinomadura sp. 7K507]
MTTYLEFAVLGLGLAAVYIGLATGLLLVYRATGIINFAQGAMAMWGAYVFATLVDDGLLVLPVGSVQLGDEVGILPALLIGLLCAAVLGVLVHYLVFRPVRNAPVLAQVVVSIGLMIGLQALAVIRFGPNNVKVESLLPREEIDVLGASLSVREMLMAAIMLVLAAGVWGYLRFTYSGAATRAASENERGAVLMGFDPNRLALVAMVLGALVSTMGVLLASTLTGLSPANYTVMIVPALAVLLIARLESIALVAVGGVVLGVFQSELSLIATKSWWPVWAKSGLEQVVPFAVIMIILFVLGRRLPARGSLQSVRLPDVTVPRIRPVPTLILLGAAVFLLLAFNDTYRFALTTSLIIALLALSYVLITGYLGQISLAQSAFAGAAGFALAKLTGYWNMPFPLAIVLCALAAAALGMAVAMPAFRIRGVQLAIVTIAAALAIERFVFGNYSLTPPSGNPIADPGLLGMSFAVREGRDLARVEFSLMVLAVVALVILMFIRVARGDTGRAFLAVRANERAAASAGIDVRRTKLMGFGLSAFIAGVAGCLLGYSQGQLSAESFSVVVGLQVLAMAYLGGITSFGGAIVAGMIGPLGLVYTAMHQWFEMGDYYALISGFALILTAIINPAGIAGKTREQIAWVRARTAGRPGAGDPGTTEVAAPPPAGGVREEVGRHV